MAAARGVLALGGCATMGGARERHRARARRAARTQTVQIYFEPDVAELTAEGRAVLAQAASEAARLPGRAGAR